jgi:hypothetical protein
MNSSHYLRHQGEEMPAQIDWLKCTSSWGKQVAEHPDTSSKALTALATHADIEVRIAVADHSNTIPETVMMLAQDQCADLRYAIAENHNIHVDVLNMLAEDDNPFVAHRARKTLERIPGGSIEAFPAVEAKTFLVNLSKFCGLIQQRLTVRR